MRVMVQLDVFGGVSREQILRCKSVACSLRVVKSVLMCERDSTASYPLKLIQEQIWGRKGWLDIPGI
jgi:hypothetical protein